MERFKARPASSSMLGDDTKIQKDTVKEEQPEPSKEEEEEESDSDDDGPISSLKKQASSTGGGSSKSRAVPAAKAPSTDSSRSRSSSSSSSKGELSIAELKERYKDLRGQLPRGNSASNPTWLQAQIEEAESAGAGGGDTEVAELKRRYKALKGTNPKGPSNNDVDWIRARIADMESEQLEAAAKRKGQEVKAEDGRGKKKRDEPPPATGDDFEGYVSDTMIEAARNGNIVDLRAILDAGIDVDSQDADSKVTPLMAAAEQGHESCLRLLLQRSAAVDKVDKDGWSALMFAAKEDRGAAVKLLVSKHGKADTELQCQEYGMTACLLACENVSPFL